MFLRGRRDPFTKFRMHHPETKYYRDLLAERERREHCGTGAQGKLRLLNGKENSAG